MLCNRHISSAFTIHKAPEIPGIDFSCLVSFGEMWTNVVFLCDFDFARVCTPKYPCGSENIKIPLNHKNFTIVSGGGGGGVAKL